MAMHDLLTANHDSTRDGGTLAIRAPNWVGDLATATPILEAALATPRWKKVVILVRQHLVPILRDGPCEAHVRVVTKDADEPAIYRETCADAALLLSNSFGSAWRALRAGVCVRAGQALSGRRLLLTHRVLPPIENGRRLAIPTGVMLRDAARLVGIEVDSLHPRLYVREEIVERELARLARAGLDFDRGYVVCAPGAAFGSAKLWPAEHFAAALDALHERHGFTGVLTGAPTEDALLHAVARAARHRTISLADEARDLEGLKALVKHARLLLVGDSGPRFCASAFDVPCVTALGPTAPELGNTWMEWCEVVRVEGLDCSPCLERRCPLGHHRCMRELEPSRVVDAAERLLARKARELAIVASTPNA
jgi:heptosyltransferase-2